MRDHPVITDDWDALYQTIGGCDEAIAQLAVATSVWSNNYDMVVASARALLRDAFMTRKETLESIARAYGKQRNG